MKYRISLGLIVLQTKISFTIDHKKHRKGESETFNCFRKNKKILLISNLMPTTRLKKDVWMGKEKAGKTTSAKKKYVATNWVSCFRIKNKESADLCARDPAVNQYWMPVIFRPSGSTALKTDMILSWKSLHGFRITSRNHCLWTQFTVPSTNLG